MSLGRLIGRLFGHEPKPRNPSFATFTAEHQADEEPTPARCGAPVVARAITAPMVVHVHTNGDVLADSRIVDDISSAVERRSRSIPQFEAQRRARSIAPNAVKKAPAKKAAPKKLVVVPRKKAAKKAPKK